MSNKEIENNEASGEIAEKIHLDEKTLSIAQSLAREDEISLEQFLSNLVMRAIEKEDENRHGDFVWSQPEARYIRKKCFRKNCKESSQ